MPRRKTPDAVLEQYKNRDAIVELDLRDKPSLNKEAPVTIRARVLRARRLWDRIDLQIETNTGTRFWTSTKKVKVLGPDKLLSD